MRRFFLTTFQQSYFHLWLLLLRLTVAGLMLTHGWPKFLRLTSGEEIKFGDPIGLGPTTSFGLAVFAEVICSVLIAVGLATRFATIPLLITMSVAAFVVHAHDPFSRQELPLLYICIYVTLLIAGGGKYSVDQLIQRKK